MRKIRVVIADDHELIRDGLRSLMEKEPDILVVGEAGDGRSTEESVSRTSPHVVIMDVTMPDGNGIETTRRILKANPRVKIIGLSGHSDDGLVLEMMSAGASAYILKETAYPDLIRAVREVVRGQKFLSHRVVRPIIDAYVRLSAEERKQGCASLTDRERQVVRLSAEGKTTKETAGTLGIGCKTVETHRRRAMQRLGARTMADMVRMAIQEGLV
jgi:DNA-binding NarL/FixJ family response regulator